MKDNPLNLTMTSKQRFYNISKNYNLTKKEEKTNINYINHLLTEFMNQLDLISLDSTWYSIMPLGRKICQSMLELLVKKEGYCITGHAPFYEIILFSSNNNLISKKYYKNLNEIRIQANTALHGDELKYMDCLSFLENFSEIINFFNKTFSNTDENIFFVNDITENINLILKNSSHTNKPIKQKSVNNSKYRFYKKEESEEIYEINDLLNDYKEQLKVLSSEKKFYYTFLGSTISELMLKLIVKKERYYNPNEKYSFFQYIELLYQHHIIPKECRNFLHLIRTYRNEFMYSNEQSYRFVLSFLKAFNYFIQWFDNYYSQNYQKKFEIEECCELIDSLVYDKTNNTITFVKTGKNLKSDYELKLHESKTNKDIVKIKNKIKRLEQTEKTNDADISEKDYLVHQEVKRLNEELKLKEEQHQKQIKELNDKNKEILKKLDEYGAMFGRCLDSISERGERIESKIDNLHLKIDNLASQIKIIQSLTERQINNAQSTEEIERLIATYIDECVENIMQHSLNFKQNQNYTIEEKKLIYSIGENGWNKLCEKSKTFLITSKVMYNHLIIMDDIIDYSGICILITKAIEVEMHKRFFTEFLDYLFGKYGRKYRNYHTALLYQNRTPLSSEKFTMGNIAFVLCYIENWNDTDEQKTNNKIQLMEYCKECIFSNYEEEEIKKLLKKYASSIEEIREKYRNPSAHTNEIKRVDAEECFNLVLDVEKLLKQMLDSFDN